MKRVKEACGKMIINYKCKKCDEMFDTETGKIMISKDLMMPVFEKDILCPTCGKVSVKDVSLTELGKKQIEKVTWD